jgi:nitroreductase/NAD-dependent dihydropyrimidine dehydrogenase PreA subunit
MSQISVDTNLCKQDGACVEVCPPRILSLNSERHPEMIDEERCIFCGHCVAVCPSDALTHAGLPDSPFLPASTEIPSPETMDGFLVSRRSVREFKPRAIPKETFDSLLEIARRAPTASNSQKLHWIVVGDSAKVHAVAGETVNWLRASGTLPAQIKQWDSGYDFVLRGAPALVVACAPIDYMWAKQDCAIALTFMELAAEARGLGVCWAGYLTRVAVDHAPLREALSVPDGYLICGGLMLGEPKYTYRRVPPRKQLSVSWL